MKRRLFVGLAYAVLVSGCGGGGSDGDGDSSSSVPEISAEGLWNGATDYDEAVSILILDDGSYWAWLSAPGGTVKDDGVIHGYGAFQNGSFTNAAGDGVGFGFVGSGTGAWPLELNASYVEKESFNGTFRYLYDGTQISFASSYDTDYELAPSLSIIAGNYSGLVQATGGYPLNFGDFYHYDSITVTISATGDINGNTDGGCLLSGTVAPRYRGNVYDLQISFTGDACPLSNPVTGVAYFEAPTNTLYGPAVNATGFEGFLFFGTKL